MIISADQLKMVEEVANQAARRASASLSKLIGAPVALAMLGTRIVETDKLAAILATPETRVSAVILAVAGEGNGASTLIVTLPESRRLTELVTKRPVAEEEKLAEDEASALKETGNIIGGAFLSALSDTTGISIVQSVPELITDTMKGVVNATVAKMPLRKTAQTMAFEIDFSLTTTTTTTETIVAHYLFLLDVIFAQKLLEALGTRKR